MKKIFKKTLCTILSFLLMGSSSAIQVSAYKVGDKIGKILSTDITAYVEGIQIPSYNIKGRTAIVAQDLGKLGGNLNFGVYFDEESRVLTIKDSDELGWGAATPLIYQKEVTGKPIGTPAGDVLYTDITTNYN